MPATNAPTTTPDGIPDGIPDCAAEGLPFPEGFLWGASTAAHQIEGNNVNSDWWQLEHSGDGRIAEPSLDAADSYHRWPEDMDLLAQLGFTDYRFSIEWARIEPAPGHFSRAELAHYRRMVDGALERGLRPMVTLHHFTLPAGSPTGAAGLRRARSTCGSATYGRPRRSSAPTYGMCARSTSRT